MTTDFASLGLREELLAGLELLSYTQMTPIQAGALPPVLAGKDVVGQAKTGSGKTAAFGLGLLNRIRQDRLAVQALVLCPTRELADQVAGEIRRLAKRSPNTRVITLCGGRASRPQRLALEQGAQVVVGTPGRVGDHLRRGQLKLGELAVLVLDEADRMLDMGFIDEVSEIVQDCPIARQTLLFSATFPERIEALSEAVQRDPTVVRVESIVETDKLRQIAFTCEKGERWSVVARLLFAYKVESALIFCETRDDCDGLADFLRNRGAAAVALHGRLEQREREDVLLRFTHGSARFLVATNVAARGLDIPELPAVVIAEVSPDPESHLHRIGRTGRAGAAGLALSVVEGPKELFRLERVEAYMDVQIERAPRLDLGADIAFLPPVNRTVMILSGRKQKLRKGDVLGALVKDAGIPAAAIGQIDLADTTCAIAIEASHVKRVMAYLKRARVKNKRVRAVLLGDSPR